MNAALIVEECTRAGLTLSVNGEKLCVDGNKNIIKQQVPRLLKFKPEIMAYLKQQAANDEYLTFDSPAQESWYYAGYNTPDMRKAFKQKPPLVQDAARKHYKTHVDEIIDHIITWCSLIRCSHAERQHMLDYASVVDVGGVDSMLRTYRHLIKQFHEVPAVLRRW